MHQLSAGIFADLGPCGTLAYFQYAARTARADLGETSRTQSAVLVGRTLVVWSVPGWWKGVPGPSLLVGNVTAIATGDMNGDGIPDVVFTESTTNTIRILLNDGKGTLSQVHQENTPGAPTRLALADFDGDGLAYRTRRVGSSMSAAVHPVGAISGLHREGVPPGTTNE